jgi:hypothetical protein
LSWNIPRVVLSNTLVSGRGFIFLLAALACWAPVASHAGEVRGGFPESTRAGIRFFERKIRPVLAERCYSCHSAKAGKMEGGLRLDIGEGVRSGGTNGPVVDLNSPANSRLIQLLRRPHPEKAVPPPRPLPRPNLADFETWIKMGAPDPRSGESPEKREPLPSADHWAFKPTLNPTVPTVRDAGWARTPVDQFILARLEQAGLRPSAPADWATLLRRATFDLTGLPPSTRELDEFEADASPEAFVKVVDRLLASPQFGERWAGQWLGLINYADLANSELSGVHENAWRYRDYVINAFNADKPYDAFIREQLAGDLLLDIESPSPEQLTATGFLLVGTRLPLEVNRTKLLLEIADEQVDLTSRVILALTISCARCHDHPSDPVTTREYYGLAGIFTSTSSLADPEEGRRGARGPVRWRECSLATKEELALLSDFETTFAELKEQLKEARERQAAFPGDVDSASLSGVVVDNLAAQVHGAWKESNYSTNFVDRNYLHDADADKGRKSARFVPDIPKEGLYEVLVSYTPRANRATNVPLVVTSKAGSKKVFLNQTLAPSVDRVFAPVGRFNFAAGTNGSVMISNEGTKGFVVVDAVRFVPVESGTAASARSAGADNPEQELLNYRQLERQVREFSSNRPVIPSAMAVQDGAIRDCRLRLKGQADKPGEEVPRGFPRVLGIPTSTRYAITDESSGRLELAHWLTNPDNPLPARVAVNRVWMQLFGRGLVDTPDDFGVLGGRPSHPELLDYLAWRFVSEGWSHKKLIRTLMLSSVYQLSSAPTEAPRSDPANRLLSRAHVRPLGADVLRDAALTLAGSLDRSMGGSWNPTNGVGQGAGQAARRVQLTSWRRSIYLPVIRDFTPEVLRAFPANAPELAFDAKSFDARSEDKYLRTLAQWWALSLVSIPAADSNARVTFAFRQALGRKPTEAELTAALKLIEERQRQANAEITGAARAESWEEFCRVLLASGPFGALQ